MKSGTKDYFVFVLALVAIPLNCYWVIRTGRGYGIDATRCSFFINVVVAVFLLRLVNSAWHRFRGKVALQPKQLLLIYSMLAISSSIAGFDTLQMQIPLLGYAFRFATPENDWANLFHRYIPHWLTVDNAHVLEGYYNGGTSLYRPEYLLAWLKPVLGWTAFLAAALFCMLCINVLMRKQWTQHERLSYPLAEITTEIMDSRSGVLRNRLLWFGFGIAFVYEMINMMNSLYPNLPAPGRMRYYINPLFPGKPWNAMDLTFLEFHSWAVGIMYFVPLDLSFSCFFFFWFWRMERIAGAILGLAQAHGFPNEAAQLFGGCAAILLVLVWAERRHIGEIFKSIFSPSKKAGGYDEEEPITYRTAALGAIVSFAVLVLFVHSMGANVGIAVVFFLFYFILAIVVTRIRAEVGYPIHEVRVRPEDVMIDIFGARRMGASSLTAFSFMRVITYSTRSHAMPQQMDALRIGDKMGVMSRNRMMLGMMIATSIVASISSFWVYLHINYDSGSYGHYWVPSHTFSRLANWVIYMRGARPTTLIYSFMGGGVCLFLMLMRRFIIWWPLHPAGFLLAPNVSMNILWFPILVSWMIKAAFLKFGGLRMYQKMRPFFLGLVLGQFVMAFCTGVLAIILNRPLYNFLKP